MALLLGWAVVVGVPILLRNCASSTVLLLWFFATAAVFGSLGALTWSQESGISMVMEEPHVGLTSRDPKVQRDPRNVPYKLTVEASPAKLPPVACNACDDTEPGASPACALLQAAAHSAEASSKGSAVDTGQSAAAPMAVMDSILAVAALRRGHLRYRSLRSPTSAPSRTQLHIKLSVMDPRDLQPNFVSTINESLRNHDSGLQVVGAYVRRGCVELTLDFVDRGCSRGDTAAAAAGSGAVPTGHAVGGGGGSSSLPEYLFLPALVLSALGVPPPAGSCSSPNAPTVLVQRAGACWSVAWDADAMQWQLRDGPDTQPDGDAVALSAPLAVHSPAQLAPGAAGSGRGALRLAVIVRGEAALALQDTGRDGLTVPPLSIIAKANGRTATASIVSVLRSAGAAGAGAEPSAVVQLEVDLARLAAGRSGRALGMVVRLELWRGRRVLDCASVACLAGEHPVSELLAMQRELSAAGDLDEEDEAYMSLVQQRNEAEQLLGDLAVWLDFVSASDNADSARALTQVHAHQQHQQHQQAELRDVLDLSEQVSSLLVAPEARATLFGAGQHLLEYFVHHGRLALACAVQADLAPRAAAGGDGAAGGGGRVARLTLLHRAVRSGSQAMVEQVVQWMDSGVIAGGGGGGGGGGATWAVRGPGGVTPLHLLAADARCCSCYDVGLTAAEAIAEEAGVVTPAEAAEAMLRWVMATWPAAVTVWNTARDSGGNTPAMLWSALGGQDIQMQAAAEALARAVARASAQPAAASEISLLPSTTSSNSDPEATYAAGGSAIDDDAALAMAAAAVAESDGKAEAGPREWLTSRPPSLLQLLRMSIWGFQRPSLERQYVDYVTVTTSPSTLVWLVIMVAAHAAAAYKSPSKGEARQAFVGAAAYVMSLAVMVLRPRAYAAWREKLMLSCLLGRTCSRLLMSTLPDLFIMSDSIQKYVLYGVDVLLDGFMEGAFEPIRLRPALIARLVEWPIMALLMTTLGMRETYGQALLRSAAVSVAGLSLSAAMDLRMRAAFLRYQRTRAAAAKKKRA